MHINLLYTFSLLNWKGVNHMKSVYYDIKLHNYHLTLYMGHISQRWVDKVINRTCMVHISVTLWEYVHMYSNAIYLAICKVMQAEIQLQFQIFSTRPDLMFSIMLHTITLQNAMLNTKHDLSSPKLFIRSPLCSE